LRGAGLVQSLESAGLSVIDRPDLRTFPCRDDPEHPTCRNVAGVVESIHAAADEVAEALPQGFVIMLGGDCALLPGFVKGARRHVGGSVGLVFLDAHGDLNTPSTTPSGRISGMALAVTLGHGCAELLEAGGTTPLVEPRRTAMLGFRDLDPGERGLVEDVGLALSSQDIHRTGARQSSDSALRLIGELPFVVHLDVDVIDGSQMLAEVPPAPGRGLTRSQMAALLRGILSSSRAIGISVTGFNPDHDDDGQHARALAEMLAGALTPTD
jgi:arginase